MNQNDMDRYSWRTGQRWSGDNRLHPATAAGWRLSSKATLLLLVAFVATLAVLLAHR